MTDSAPPATFRTLLHLAWPIVLARATQAVVGFTDAAMVAPLGEDELAATTTGALDTYAAIILPQGIVMIVQSFAAQLSGQGRRGDSRRYAWYGLLVAAIAMVVALAALPLLPLVLGQLGTTPQVRDLMVDYMGYRFLSVGAAVGMEVLGAWYGGLGNTRMQLVGGTIAMIANIGLNWILIYGNLGAPAMGVAGAALASSIATWIAFAWLAWAFHRGLGGAPRPQGRLRLRLDELRRMVRFGLPNGINWFLEFAAFLVFLNVVVVDLGTPTLAAMNVVLAINMVSFMPAFGIAASGAILTGQAIGRGDHTQVPRVVWLTMRTAAAWQGAIAIVYLAVPQQLVGLFRPEDVPAETLLAVGVLMLQLSAAWQVFDAVAMTLSETLRAAGDTTWPMMARLLLAWFAFVPAGVVSVMVLGGGEVAAMVCLIIYLALLASLLALRFRAGAWSKIDLTGVEPRLVE